MNTKNDDHSTALRNPADGDPRLRRERVRKYMASRLMNRTKLDSCGQLALRYKPCAPRYNLI